MKEQYKKLHQDMKKNKLFYMQQRENAILKELTYLRKENQRPAKLVTELQANKTKENKMLTRIENGVQICLKLKEGELTDLFTDEQIDAVIETLEAEYTPLEAKLIERHALDRMFGGSHK